MIMEISSRAEREKKLNIELGRVVSSLKKAGVKKVILFGSLAVGNVNTSSGHRSDRDQRDRGEIPRQAGIIV